jgi:hypothetical protein
MGAQAGTPSGIPEPPDGLTRLLVWLLNTDAVGFLARLWQAGQLMIHSRTQEGMVELLDYEAHLELCDTRGRKAISRKRQRVRFLQNRACTYQATLALVLFANVVDRGEYGDWLRRAVELCRPPSVPPGVDNTDL